MATLSSMRASTIALAIGMCGLPAGAQTAPAEKLEVRLSRVARITPDASGSYTFFRVAAAPDARDVMVCTLHHALSTNQQTAELFHSADGGETWSLRLVDGSSQEVSEDACAFGESGKAYFAAQPWNVNAPYEGHSKSDKSEMHLYRSSTYGEVWPAFLVAPFVDYARIVVDSRPDSPFRGRAYIAGNTTAAEDFPLFAILDGGKQLIKALQPESFPKTHEGGKYPHSLIVLKNGDVLVSYLAARKTADGISLGVVLTATRDGGKTLTNPVILDQNVYGDASLAEVQSSGEVVAFYAVKNGSSYLLTLARSTDKGQTWERMPVLPQGLVKPPPDGIVLPRAITLRADGLALLTWTANRTVYGAVLNSSWRPIWSGEIIEKSVGSAMNLAPYIVRDYHHDGSPATSDPEDMDIRLQFEVQGSPYPAAEAVLKNDNSFLAVWRAEDGQLYARSVRLLPSSAPPAPVPIPARDVTALVRYEAANIMVDGNANTLQYDLSLVNASDTPIVGPLVLKIKDVASTVVAATLQDFGTNEIVFAAQRPPTLLPGEHTSAVRVRIQFSPDAFEKIRSSSNPLPKVNIIGRVYAQSPPKPN